MIIKSGQLIYKGGSSHRMEPYYIKLIGKESLMEVENLQQSVYRALKRKEILVTDSIETMSDDLNRGGMILGVYNGSGSLVAYRFVSYPDLIDTNLGRDIKLKQESLNRVAHLETTVVHPDYRGNGLQSETLALALPIIESQGFEHVLCTVSPFNPHSLYNVMYNGLKIKALKLKYPSEEHPSGMWRFILHKDLTAKSPKKVLDWLNVSMSSFELQEELIEKGFVGNWVIRDQKILQYIRFQSEPLL